ncbi:hypothetical protein GUA87_03725 [Sneathiella sp. P13V-1]|uniref:MAE_28990/MAE_18760 family HEPN-like nuclease n=1 Tax=Sneathiella sp. P13V-1 TaxID=2697366 RepID=UPI00187B4C30|nr:MAE_28990/MAE_18760 family HEPN-like nuclease [Sneathiella sp. P13V-1]MBE7635939.1 hypothetical protein [Sneathiella sp. P13V-1]
MRDVSLNRIAINRIWRAREISDVRAFHYDTNLERNKKFSSRAVIVLCYAHWEGYFADCINTLIDYFQQAGFSYYNLNENFILGAVTPIFDSYKNKTDNLANRLTVTQELRGIKNQDFALFDRKVLLPRSNLNFDRLRFVYSILGEDIQPFQKHRIRLDGELVKWRHMVAHGEMFTMENDFVKSHTQLCEELMLLIGDTFENLIYEYS